MKVYDVVKIIMNYVFSGNKLGTVEFRRKKCLKRHCFFIFNKPTKLVKIQNVPYIS